MDPCFLTVVVLNARIAPSFSSFILSGTLTEVMLATQEPPRPRACGFSHPGGRVQGHLRCSVPRPSWSRALVWGSRSRGVPPESFDAREDLPKQIRCQAQSLISPDVSACVSRKPGAGFRAVLSVPLLREEQIIGSLSLTRKSPGEFSPEVIEVLKTFATQSALAMAFIAGFTVVFVSLGASFSAAGQFLLDYRDWIRIGGGVLLAAFGLLIAGVLKWGPLGRTR